MDIDAMTVQAMQARIAELVAENEAFREAIIRMRDALRWCGGSSDFAPGGLAHAGWNNVAAPLVGWNGYTPPDAICTNSRP
jgi:hypothetical protein